MDPPLLPPQHTTTSAAASAAIPTSIHLNYPDSVVYSPRSLRTDTIHDHLPPVPAAKLRLMCSYGGHIMPRFHDKVLCYVGGDTRMVVVDRHSTLSSLTTRLSRILLNGHSFTLKYQLPNEDLDSLVSVTIDEDLENMIEEYDRITSASNSSYSCRIRLFLFFNKPETAASMGRALLDDAKSETWFVDALNGSGLMSRNLSDSATVDCLLNFDDGEEIEEPTDQVEKNKLVEQSGSVMPVMSDSPLVENSSSSSSSPSIENLPPIRVRIEDKTVGLEEQFSQMASVQVAHKQEEGSGPVSAIFPPSVSEHMNRVLSDDERYDQGGPIGFRKPPLPLPLQLVQQKACCRYNLPSPDSVASDSSIASANSLSKQQIYYQAPTSPNAKDNVCIQTSQISISDSGYSLPPQFDQQQQHQQLQYVHASAQSIPHPAATPVPITSYYQMYAPQSQHHPTDHHQQYPPPVYLMPVAQTQPYLSTADTTVAASTRPLTPPIPTIITSSMHYKDGDIPPIYPSKPGTAAAAKPEAGGGVYRTAMTSNPSSVQIPPSQYQQQYVGYSQMQQHSAQSIAVGTACYGYDQYYNSVVPDHRMYYSQHLQASSFPMPPQYQTMTAAAATKALADTSKQLLADAAMALANSSKQLPADAAITLSDASGNVAATGPEMGGGVYRTPMTSNPPPVQVPPDQYQHQYGGYAQMQQHPVQSIPAGTACYGYDQYYNSAAPDHQMYHSQHLQASSSPMPPQYQTMTPVAAAIALADASKQLPADSSKPQNITSSQPL